MTNKDNTDQGGLADAVSESQPSHKQTVTLSSEPETFEHMLTVVMIMVGDDRERDDDKLWDEAFEYGISWHQENQVQVEGIGLATPELDEILHQFGNHVWEAAQAHGGWSQETAKAQLLDWKKRSELEARIDEAARFEDHTGTGSEYYAVRSRVLVAALRKKLREKS